MKVQILISLIIFSLLGVACTPSTTVPSTQMSVDPTTDACKLSAEASKTLTPSASANNMVLARAVLVAFFDALNDGWYAEADVQYGGSYEELIAMNPGVDPNDHTALLEHACTINGFQCLKVKQIVQQVQDWPDTYTFTIEFLNPDSSPFVLGTCCGASETDMPPQSRFDVVVMRVPQAGNALRVQSLPVYVP
jgi:hypothetical protein